MNTLSEKLAAHWKDAANFVLGLWLLFSPWALAYTATPVGAQNAWIVGPIIATAALAALVTFYRWKEWVNVALAAWLVVSPWVLGFARQQAVVWNQVIVGLLVGGLAAWAALATEEGTGLSANR